MSSSQMESPFVSMSRRPKKVLRAALLITGLLAVIALVCLALDTLKSPSPSFLAKQIPDTIEWPHHKSAVKNNYQATLIDSSDPFHHVYSLKKSSSWSSEQDIVNLKLDVFVVNDNSLRFQLRDADNKRFEIPEEVLSLKTKDQVPPYFDLSNIGLKINTNPFSFSLTLPNNVKVFDSEGQNLIYQDQYIEFGFNLNSPDIYGLGERIGNFALKDGSYAMWSTVRDNPTPDAGQNEGNREGFHPFLLNRPDDSSYLGYYMANVNAQTVNKTNSKISHVLVGGILDFYLFFGKTPQHVIQLYQNVIGRPALLPYSAINWHIDLQSYDTVKDINTTIADFAEFYKSHQYLDTYLFYVNFWMGDNSLNEKGQPFVLNDEFKDIAAQFSKMCEDLKLWMPECIYYFRHTAASPNQKSYPYFLDNNVVTNGKKPVQFKLLEAGKMHQVGNPNMQFQYPDLMASKGRTTWVNGLTQFLTQTKGKGVCLTYPSLKIQGKKEEKEALNGEDFTPGVRDLDTNALPTSSQSSLGSEYNVHNLDQLVAIKVAYEEMQKTKAYPGLFTQSSMPGMGQYAGYWDNNVPFQADSLRYIVSQALKFNMFGIPYVGTDSCGDVTDKTWDQDLCYTWFNLATMMPMSRMSRINSSHFKKYSFFSNMFFAFTRPFDFEIYSKLVEVHEKGGMVWKPVFFTYDEDQYRADIESAILISDDKFYAPPLTTASKYTVTLPAGVSWWSCSYGCRPIVDSTAKSRTITFSNSQSFSILSRGSVIHFSKYAKQLRSIFLNEGSNRLSGKVAIPEVRDPNKYPTIVTMTYIERVVGVHSSRHDMSLDLGEFHTFYILYPDSGKRYNPFVCVLGRENAGDTLAPLDFKVEFVWADSAVEIAPNSDKKYTIAQTSLVQFGDITLNNQNYCYDSYFVKYRQGDLSDSNLAGQLVSYNDTTQVLSFYYYGFQKRTNAKIKMIWFYNDFFPAEKAGFKPSGVRATQFGAEWQPLPLNQAGLTSMSDTTQTFKYTIVNSKLQVKLSKMIMDQEFLWYKFSANVTFLGCYGYGERRIDSLNLCKSGDKTLYTLWNNKDKKEGVEEGVSHGRDGSHPVVFFVYSPEPNTYKYFGLFFLNTNAQELKIQKISDTQTDITFIATGGMAEYYFLNPADSFNQLLQGYQSIVGRPPLIPLSTLGFHSFSSKPKNAAAIRDQVSWYANNKLPLEGVFLDLSYLENYKAFTLNQEFKDLKDIYSNLNKAGMTLVLQVPSNIAYDQSNPAYKLGHEYDIFIKTASEESKELVGKYYGGSVVYPQFMSIPAQNVWEELLGYLSSTISPFDGLWLVDNHHYNLCDGECEPQILKEFDSQLQSLRYNLTYQPPYFNLGDKTLSLDARHSLSTQAYNIEKNLHSLNGLLQMQATDAYFINQKKRNYIISDSTFSGAGKLGYHIITGVTSTFESLKMAVADLLNFNFFAMPMVGTELCGHFGPPQNLKQSKYQADLCNRWLQLAVFYPMVVNRKTDTQLGGLADLNLHNVKYALDFRYGLLSYIYTQFFNVHIYGGAVYRPVFFEFNEDPNKFTETHFMIGQQLLVTAVLQESVTSITDYFPAGTWAHIFNGTLVHSKGEQVTINVDQYSILAHIREGSVVSTQNVFGETYGSTASLLTKPIDLSILAKQEGDDQVASGELIYDDGKEQQVSIEQGDYEGYRFAYASNKLAFIKESQTPNTKPKAILGDIWIYNWQSAAPSAVNLVIEGGSTVTLKSEVVKAKTALHIIGQKLPFNQVLYIQIKV